MKEMGLSRPKLTSPGWPGLALGGATTGAMPRWWPSSQVATTTARGRLGDRHMPHGRRPPGPANVGVTEDRGKVVWRIKEDVTSECTSNARPSFGAISVSYCCLPRPTVRPLCPTVLHKDPSYLSGLSLSEYDICHFHLVRQAMWKMMQLDEPQDLVISTGEVHSVREFVEAAFAEVSVPSNMDILNIWDCRDRRGL